MKKYWSLRFKLQTCSLLYCISIHPSIYLSNNVAELLRSVEHQSVPLALDVVVLRLLGDVDTVKLQLSGQLLLSLEDNQRNLTEGKEDKLLKTYEKT